MDERFCPECESSNVVMEAGGIGGAWICNECGYVGIAPERSIEENNIDKKTLKKIWRKKR